MRCSSSSRWWVAARRDDSSRIPAAPNVRATLDVDQVVEARIGVLARRTFAELPPRVEYRFAPFGERFLEILDATEQFQGELDGRSSGA